MSEKSQQNSEGKNDITSNVTNQSAQQITSSDQAISSFAKNNNDSVANNTSPNKLGSREERIKSTSSQGLGYIHQDNSPNLPHSSDVDTVDGIYTLHLNEPLDILSNDFCKYYYASSKLDDKEYFAIVFDNSYVHPLEDISKLSKNKIRNLNNILSYSVVVLSRDSAEHLVIIVDSYEYGSSLATYLEDKGEFSIGHFEKLVAFLANLLIDLNNIDIFQCDICPENIIMQDGEFLFLKEFFTSTPNFYQKNQYIPPELIECTKEARKCSSPKVEIYSLAITLYESFIGKHPWRDFKSEIDYNYLRLENTSFKYLLAKARIAERFRAFFRFTMHDDAYLRWKPINLLEWLGGKLGNYNKHELIGEKNNQLTFEDKSLSNLKSIAFALFHNWDEAIKFLKTDKLYKWAVREQINDDIVEEIKSLVENQNSNQGGIISTSVNSNTKMIKLLSIIDPMGPIRQAGLALSALSIPEYMSYLVAKYKKVAYEDLVKIIKDESWRYYNIDFSIGFLSPAKGEVFKHESLGVNFSSPIKGVERLVYSLNPASRCFSKMLDRYYVVNLSDLLVALDKYAKMNPSNFIFDRHIIAYISSKLNIKDRIRPVAFSYFPRLSEHPVIVTLSILYQVVQIYSEVKIPNICIAMVNEIKELMEDHLHGVEFKKSIMKQLDEAPKTSQISSIIEVLSDQTKFINDYNGYFEACNKIKTIDAKLNYMKNSDKLFKDSLLFGQKSTVLSSYILCLIVTVVAIL